MAGEWTEADTAMLRAIANGRYAVSSGLPTIRRAADEIERLTASEKRLKEAWDEAKKRIKSHMVERDQKVSDLAALRAERDALAAEVGELRGVLKEYAVAYKVWQSYQPCARSQFLDQSIPRRLENAERAALGKGYRILDAEDQPHE
jgi:chromosome segregation ATPase